MSQGGRNPKGKTGYRFTEEQVTELQQARKKNKNKNVEKRLQVLLLRAEGMSRKDIAEKTDYTIDGISKIVTRYQKQGLGAIVENHYPGNRRNLTYEEEEELLQQFQEKAEQGQMISVAEIKEAYVKKVGHSIGSGQIYYVLKRHGWKKKMPRSKHPNSASEEAINASKKLTIGSGN